LVEQPTEQEIIDTGRRVAQFIQDPAIQYVVAALATQYYADFKTAKTNEDRLLVQAKSTVLDDFLNGLQVQIDRGEVAQKLRKSREEREARAQQVS